MDQHEFELQKFQRENEAEIKRLDKEIEKTRIDAELRAKEIEASLRQLEVNAEVTKDAYTATTERAVAILIPLSIVAVCAGILAAVVTLVGGCS